MNDDERQFEDFVSSIKFDDTPDPGHRNKLEEKLLDALTKQTPRQIKIWSTIMKSQITKLAAAAVIIIGLVLVMYHDNGSIDITTPAFARMMEAMEKMPLMHKVLHTRRDGKDYRTENWYSFDSKTVLSRFSVGGECFKISSLNYDTMENVVYDPNSDLVRILYRIDVSTNFLPASPWAVVKDYVEQFKQENAVVEQKKGHYQGEDVDIYGFSIERNYRNERVNAQLVVGRSSHLPIAYKRKFWTREGRLYFDQVISFDFPENGPKDIYDLGVPKSTEVFYDSASKKLLERMRRLLEDRASYERQFSENSTYRLEEGQVLKHIPPSLTGPRARIDQINEEILKLKRASRKDTVYDIQQSDRVDYCTMFGWDGKIIARPRPVFKGGVSLKTAFERIIGLSKFEYKIPAQLLDIKISGDWIKRKGTSKKKLVRAFEKIVQDYTRQSIRFEQRHIERDVIVAKGKFRFTPLSGTYEDSWVHVFSDKLDPDEGGGGGSGSLDKFLRDLGDIPLNQQVINETENSGDIEVRYGWHYSGYIRKIAVGRKRMEKLKMLLDNLSRQTGLKFKQEQRKVSIWIVKESNIENEE